MSGSVEELRQMGFRRGILPCLLIVAGVSIYLNSLATPFVFDDTKWIVKDRHIYSLSRLPVAMAESNRPILILSLAINYALGETNVVGYHIVNVIIHILAALTLFGIVSRTLLANRLQNHDGQSAKYLAFAVAMIWMVHPLHTQAVTYTIQRSESLMGLFYLLTLYCVIRMAQSENTYRWTIAAIVVCTLGMGTKEVMVTAPLVVFLYDRTFLSHSFGEALRRRRGLYLGLAATWVVLIGFVGVNTFVKENTTAGFGMKSVRPWEYMLSQPAVILHYLRLSFWPHPLVLDYWWPIAKKASQIVPAGMAIIGMLAISFWGLWRRSAAGFLGIWFFLILAPSSSVMPIQDLVFEHRMYLSLAAVVVLVVVLGHEVVIRHSYGGRVVAISLLVLVVGALSVTTIFRNRDYHSEIAIWQNVLKARPRNPRAYTFLGIALNEQKQYEGAIGQLHKAIDLAPGYPAALLNLGIAHKLLGTLDQAKSYYRRAIRSKPDYAEAYYNLALVLQNQGKRKEAIQRYFDALRLDPNHAEAHNNLGRALDAQGNSFDALRHYRRAIDLRPDYAKAHNNLGAVLASQGQINEAVKHFQKAVWIDPEYAWAHFNLGTALSAKGDRAMAVEHFREAVRLDPTVKSKFSK